MLVIVPVTDALASVPKRDYEAELKNVLIVFGQPADTPEDLKAALDSKYDVVRAAALRLFTEREGQGFIPVMKEYLTDEHAYVRYVAAKLLSKLGDRSGLETMRADFQSLLPPGKTPMDPGEPNAIIRLQDALEVGSVLAELGEDSALTLALKSLPLPGDPARRSAAVKVLGRVARASGKREHRQFALDALAELAASDQEYIVQTGISAAAREMEPRSAARLFGALAESRHAPDWLRKSALKNKREKEKQLAVRNQGQPVATSQPYAVSRASTRPFTLTQPATRPDLMELMGPTNEELDRRRREAEERQAAEREAKENRSGPGLK